MELLWKIAPSLTFAPPIVCRSVWTYTTCVIPIGQAGISEIRTRVLEGSLVEGSILFY
jgi:hypothetical protein